MPATNQILRDFGYSFLGPIFGTFIQQLDNEYPGATPVCLAREGWPLEKIIRRAQQSGFAKSLKAPIYLKISRSLLFKILAGDTTQWGYFFNRPYAGTIGNLLSSRFGMTQEHATEIISENILKQIISLPRDAVDLERTLLPFAEFFLAHSEPTLRAFSSYVEKVGITNPDLDFVVIDVGYSGTIQMLLTSVIKRDTKGKYFITCVPEKNKVGNFTSMIKGCFLTDVRWGEGHLMLERSLLLESIMTAPHGQVRDIYMKQDGTFEFFYGRQTYVQNNFHDLLAIFDGAEECVVDMFKNNVVYSAQEIRSIFTAFATPWSAIPRDVRRLFDIDDDFSGNGVLNAVGLFGL